MTSRTATRRALLAAVAVAALAACTTGRQEEGAAAPVAAPPTGSGATSAPVTGEPPAPPETTVPVDVDTAPARAVALAMATGDDGADLGPYLDGQEAATKVGQVVARGAEANASSLSRLGTVRHARTLDDHETVEQTTTGVIMVTVFTVGWDAAPGDQDAPPELRHAVSPGIPGTRAWYLTVSGSGAVTGAWEDHEVPGTY